MNSPSAGSDAPRVALLWALCCAVGVWLLAPSAAWYDSGELAGAAVTLGVPHPTGFAGFLLAGHTAAGLPFGSAALRVHAMGLLAGAIGLWSAAQGLARCLPAGHLARRWLPLVAPSLLLVPSVALHLRSSEVYPLLWLLVGLALQTATLQAPKRLGWLGLLAGLALTVHAEAALLVGALWFVTALQLRQHRRWLVVSVVLGVVAALTLLALPLAARRSPWLLWEQTDRLPGLLRHLSAAGIREAFADEMGAAAAADGWRALVQLVVRDLGWTAVLALPGVGWLVWLLRREPAQTQRLWPFALVVSLASAYAAIVNPMGLRDQQTGQLLVVALGMLGWLGLLGWLGWLGQLAALGRLPVGPTAQRLVALLLAGGVITAGSTRLVQLQPALDLQAAPAFFDAAWRRVPPGAVLIAASDHQASMCVWQQAAEGQRPDSRCIPGVFLRNGTTLANLAHQTGWQGLIDAALVANQSQASGPKVLAAWLRPALGERSVLWEPGLAVEDAQVLDHALPGLAWSTVAQNGPVEADRLAAAVALPDAATRACQTLTASPICAEAPTLAGLLGSRLGLHAAHIAPRHAALARQLLNHALQLAPNQPRLLHNRGALALQEGDAGLALELVTAALARDPTYRRAHRTAARAALGVGQADLAATHLAAGLQGWPAGKPLPQWAQAVLEAAPPADRARLETAARGAR